MLSATCRDQRNSWQAGAKFRTAVVAPTGRWGSGGDKWTDSGSLLQVEVTGFSFRGSVGHRKTDRVTLRSWV